MGRPVFIFGFILIANSLFAQQIVLVKQWDVRFGGPIDDELSLGNQLKNTGYLLVGGSTSGRGGDKTQDNWDTSYQTSDFWVVKIGSAQNKIWDKRYGGFSNDWANTFVVSNDGNYVIAGYSSSDSDGDKTQPSWGGGDYWMIKIDTNGNMLWNYRYGGSGEDVQLAFQPTSDNGFILGGYTYSPADGDITQPNWGSVDYWVLKTDSAGNKQWNARFGGSGYNFMTALVQTRDGGYLLGGESNSDSSGDKSQNNCTSDNYNYWIIRIDSAGNKLWDKRYGSNGDDYFQALIQTSDRGFLLGGSSSGTVGCDKTSPLCGGQDYWIIKIDSAGNKLWDKDYGGPSPSLSQLSSLYLCSDGGFLIAGSAVTDSGCQKSENNIGYWQTWIIKTDSAGNELWDKTIFTDSSNNCANAFQTSDGCYLISTFTNSQPAYYKTQPAWDASGDYWIVKFCEGPAAITEISDSMNINVYPNPFSSELDINIAQQGLKQATFTITNELGQQVYSQQENNLSDNYTKMLDLSYLANGVYLVAVEVNGERVVREVVKE